MNRYPDRDADALRADLATYLTRSTGHRVSTDMVWAANGSNEVLQQLLQAFGGAGRTALGFDPTYSMHQLIAQGTGTAWLPVPRLPGFRLEPEQAALVVREHAPDVVFLCSPNNPTGTALDLDVIEAVYAAATGLVVVDEAYAEFSTRPSAIGLLPGRPRLVVTRTMSKAFAFAAARLGYLAADPSVVQALQLVRLPYHLSVLTQAAARAALARADELLASVAAVVEQRDRLLHEITALGLEVVPSDGNFVLFGEFGDQHATWQGLLDRGVLVRDVGLPGWLRVTAGTEAETTTFLDALRDGLAAADPVAAAVGSGSADDGEVDQ
jgi:histidinol-phosphate aminotransferase